MSPGVGDIKSSIILWAVRPAHGTWWAIKGCWLYFSSCISWKWVQFHNRTKGRGVKQLMMPIFFLFGFNSVYKALTLVFSYFFLFISRHWCSFLCCELSSALSRWGPLHWCHYLLSSGHLWGSFVYVSHCLPLWKLLAMMWLFQRLLWGNKMEWLCIAVHSDHSCAEGWGEHQLSLPTRGTRSSL